MQPERADRQLTRREFAARSLASSLAWAGFPAAAAAESVPAPPTIVLINRAALQKQYPQDAAALLQAVEDFAGIQNGDIIDVGQATTAPAKTHQGIKAQLLRHPRRPKRLVIIGDEQAIPRFPIKLKSGNGKAFFFKGDQYLRYDLLADRVDDGYPQPLDARHWPGWPASWNSVDAAFNWGNGKAFFFKGDQYLRCDVAAGSVDNGFPRPLDSRDWYDWPADWKSVDAAFNWGNRKAYFFNGDQYLRYDLAAGRVDDGFPQPLDAGHWPRWPADWKSVDAAFNWGNGKAYFFRGGRYLRYDLSEDRVDSGYPQPLDGKHRPGWPTSWNTGIDAAVEWGHFETLDVDYFYGDLDRDGLAEVTVCRVLGSPRAMLRQLGNSGRQVDSPRALVFGDEPRAHLEMNRFVSFLGDAGCAVDFRGAADLPALASADVIGLEGGGDPHGLYGGSGAPYVTASTVPDLPLQPVVFAVASSTATPGAPIVRAFLEKGCRVYVGAASGVFGWTPGAYGNELFMHMLDVARAHPDWTVAEIIGESRNRYVRVKNLGPTLLRLERGERVDFELAHVSTALQLQVFGDVTARFPAARPRHPFALHLFTSSAVTLRPGTALPIRFHVGPSDGIPTLFLRADWASDVCAHLEIEISQNGQLLHTIDWKKRREWYEFVDMNVGGYADGERYHAYAIVPLFRKEGENAAAVTLKHSPNPIQLLPDSAVQVWTRRSPPHPPPKQLARKAGINLLLLSDRQGLDPLRDALAGMEHVQVDVQDSLGNTLDPYEFPDQQDQFLDLSLCDVILIDELPRGFHQFPRGSTTRIRDFVKRGGGLIMLGGHKTFGGNRDDGGFAGTPIEELLPVWIGKHLQVFTAESVYLARLGGFTDPGANVARSEAHLDWARGQPADVVADNLVWKYTLQFDRQARAGTAAAQRFFGEASARLASYGVDLGDAGANLKESGPHVEWARRQSNDALRQSIEKKVRTLFAGVPNGLIVEQKTTLGPINPHPVVEGLDWSHVPEIDGHNRVIAKPDASVLASTRSGDPVLAIWQFGKGRSAAFTTSFGRKWAPGFAKWPDYSRFWGNLVRWVSRAGEQPD